MNTTTIPRYPVTIAGETAHIGTAAELAVALDVLHGRHDREVLEQLRPHLADVISTPSGLLLVVRSLAPPDRMFLFEALGGRTAGLLKEARYLRDLLATLAHLEVEQCLLNVLGTAGLRALILTAEHLAEVLEWVYGECDRQVFELLGADYIRGLVHNCDELALILNSMDRHLQGALLDLLGWDEVVRLVTDGRDLAMLMRALPSDGGARLLAHFSGAGLAALINNAADWTYLWQRLEPAEADALLSRLEVTSDAA